jgi:hypothetical protein
MKIYHLATLQRTLRQKKCLENMPTVIEQATLLKITFSKACRYVSDKTTFMEPFKNICLKK